MLFLSISATEMRVLHYAVRSNSSLPFMFVLALGSKKHRNRFLFFFNEQIIPVFIKNGTLLLDFGSI